jgi:protein-tyrosine sulfotransferase
MSRRRPDRRWRSPGFALRRLLRLTTTDPGGYGLSVDPEIVIAIAERARASRPALGRGAALLLGPTPRSGTNYVEAIVSAHPHVATAPCGVREAPFLAAAETIRPFEQEFGRRHAETSRGLVPYEWLGYAASGFLARAAAEAGPERLILLKDPHALRLDLAEAIFPDAKRLIVLRDGRRTVDSCVRTWALRRLGRTFADICLEWALATNAALDHVARSGGAAMAIRYEDAVAAPASVARAAQGFLGLDPGLARLTDLHATPVMGSSTHSRGEGAVDWAPRAPAADFDPAGRAVDWPKKWERTFARICGPAAARLAAEAPAGMGAGPAETRLAEGRRAASAARGGG